MTKYTHNKLKDFLGPILGGILVLIACLYPINRASAYSDTNLTFFKGIHFDEGPISYDLTKLKIYVDYYNPIYFTINFNYVTNPGPGQFTIYLAPAGIADPLFTLNSSVSYTPVNALGQTGPATGYTLPNQTFYPPVNDITPLTIKIPGYTIPSGYTHYRASISYYMSQPGPYGYNARLKVLQNYTPSYVMLPLLTNDNYTYNGESSNYNNIFYRFSDLVPVINITSPLNGSLISNSQAINLIGNIADYISDWSYYNALDLTLIDKTSNAQYQYFTTLDSNGNFNFILSNLPSNTPSPNPGYSFRFTLDNTIIGTNFWLSQTPDYSLQVTTYIPANPYNSDSPYANYTSDDPQVWYQLHYPGLTSTAIYNNMTGYIGPAFESANEWFSAFSANFDTSKAQATGLNIADSFKTALAYEQNINDIFPVDSIVISISIYIAFELAILTAKSVLTTVKIIKP